MRRALFACLLALASLGGAGCSEYRYYDVEVSFNLASGQFMLVEVGTIQACRVTVSGADSATFNITNERSTDEKQFCPPTTNNQPRSVMGIFEYSSHAESGELTFTMDVWDAFTEFDNCKIGSGSVTVPITGTTTTEGISLVVNKTGTGCM